MALGHFKKPSVIIVIGAILSALTQCSQKEKIIGPSDDWDIAKNGIPKFVRVNYIELDSMARISKFRSSVGHDYSDAFEQCRSLKHYFEPKANVNWAAIRIFSPVTGTVTRVTQEWAGTRLEIVSKDYPAFRFVIFHINMPTIPNINDPVAAGQLLGTHIGSQTYSDIAVLVNEPTHQGMLISYFDLITDSLFSTYSLRGVTGREDLIIPKSNRDASPLMCSGDTFTSVDTLQSWFVLN